MIVIVLQRPRLRKVAGEAFCTGPEDAEGWAYPANFRSLVFEIIAELPVNCPAVLSCVKVLVYLANRRNNSEDGRSS